MPPSETDTRPLDEFADCVLGVVEEIPPGRVMSYGDIAEYLGTGGPRQVGKVMAAYGGAVAWWRVVHADGTPAPGHDSRALARYLAEGTPLRSARRPVRVDMSRARWHGRNAVQPGGTGRLRGLRYRGSECLAAGPGPNVGGAW